MSNTETWLVGIIIPFIVGPLSVFFKSLWDRYNSNIELKKKTRYDCKMTELSDKINLFYWPVFLKLKTLDRLNYDTYQQNKHIENKCFDITMCNPTNTTNSDFSSDGENKFRPIKRKKRFRMCNNIDSETNSRCRNIIKNPSLYDSCEKCNSIKGINENNSDIEDNTIQKSENDITDPPSIIKRNMRKFHSRLSHISLKIDYSSDNVSNTEEINKMEWDNTSIYKKPSIRKIRMRDDSEYYETGESDDNTSGNSANIMVSVDKFFMKKLDIKILQLCKEITNLVENNISTIRPSNRLIKEIIKFTRYTEMIEVIFDSKQQNEDKTIKYNLKDLGVINNTKKFYALIKSNLDQYMKEYSDAFNDYNSYEVTSCCRK
jgi:hypothetical protein